MTIGTAFLIAAFTMQSQVGSEIQGTVLSQRRGEASPLPFAMVEVSSPTGRQAVWADRNGRYHLVGLPSGVGLRVRAVHVGHDDARLAVTVPVGGVARIDLVLTAKPIELPVVHVVSGLGVFTGQGTEGVTERDLDEARAQIALRALEVTPGLAEVGLAQAVERLPGNDPPEPGDVLFMRGSTADLKLVLLDGAPVYTPFHLGGLLQSFDPAVLGSAQHHVGGAPARYDGGLAYVLDLRTRAPRRDRFRSSGSVDLMSARGNVETPLGDRGGALFSARTLHGLQSRLAGAKASPYGYVDGFFRADLDLWRGHRLSGLAFGNDESVRLDLDADRARSEDQLGLTPGEPGHAGWSNAVASLSYVGEWERSSLEISATTTRYRANLPLPTGSPAPEGEPSAEPGTLLARGETGRSRLAADAVRLRDSGAIRFGVAVDATRLEVAAYPVGEGASGEGPFEYTRTASGTVVGGYFDLMQRLGSQVYLRTGLRLDHFSEGGTRGAVRLALHWSLTDDALLTVAGGQYHQLVRTTDPELDLAVGDVLTAGTGGLRSRLEEYPLLSVASSDHLVISLDQQLTPDVRLTTEGFFKHYKGLEGLGRGNLNSSGIDLRVLREGERLTGWLGYSLSWFWDSPDPLGSSEDFVGRQLLSTGVNGRIGTRFGWDAALSYSDGLPLTSIPFSSRASLEASPTVDTDEGAGSPLAGRVSGSFLRIDLQAFADLETTWWNRAVHVRPYFKVLNALDRRDALFYYFEPWRDRDLRPLAEQAVIPVLGVEWRF